MTLTSTGFNLPVTFDPDGTPLCWMHPGERLVETEPEIFGCPLSLEVERMRAEVLRRACDDLTARARQPIAWNTTGSSWPGSGRRG